MATSGIFDMTTEQQNALLAKLVEKEERTKQRGREYREKNKDKMNEWSERARIRSMLMVRKAKEQGIEVTNEELDLELARLHAEK